MPNKKAFLELHMIQNFAPANLNRDDTNTPKTCDFGCYRRARISSQCIKRSIRTHPVFHDIVSRPGAKGTYRLFDEMKKKLLDAKFDGGEIDKVLMVFLKELVAKWDKKNRTKIRFFLGPEEFDGLLAILRENWNEMLSKLPEKEPEPPPEGAGADAEEEQEEEDGAKKTNKNRSPLAVFCADALKNFQAGSVAADLALFGRMIADKKASKYFKNVDAACQVAHAISTHRINMEMDFYTAVDDLQPKDDVGAGMMGTVEFNSSCFYRYAMIDLVQLAQNLAGDRDLAAHAAEGFLRAAIAAVPSGKQNSFAQQQPPSFVFATVRNEGAPWSLANAFVRPINPHGEQDVITESVRALDVYWGELIAMFGKAGKLAGLSGAAICGKPDALKNLADNHVPGVEALVDKIMEAVQETKEGAPK